MALAININDLLNKQKIESNRIEFKKGPSSPIQLGFPFPFNKVFRFHFSLFRLYHEIPFPF